MPGSGEVARNHGFHSRTSLAKMRGSIGDDRCLALVAAVRQLLKAKGGNVRSIDHCDMSAHKFLYGMYGLVTLFVAAPVTRIGASFDMDANPF